MKISIRSIFQNLYYHRLLFSMISTGLSFVIIVIVTLVFGPADERRIPSLKYLTLCYWVIVSLLAYVFFVFEKHSKSVPSRFLKLFVILTGVALLLFFGLIIALHPDSIVKKAYSQMLNEGRKDLSVCSFAVPEGWYSQINSKFNGVNECKLIYMDLPIIGLDGEVPTALPYIVFAFRYSHDEKAFLKTSLGLGVSSFDSTKRIIREFGGKEVVFFRYEGVQRMDNDVNIPVRIISSDEKAVTIAFCSEFGFYGFFWGTPQYESVFWSTLDSIEWKGVE